MALKVTRVTNANVYINGNNMLGRVESFNVPELKPVMKEHKALGMIGEMEFPAGLDKLEAKLKTAGLYDDMMKYAYSIYDEVSVQIRSNAEEYTGSARTAERPIKIFLRGTFKGAGAPNFQARDNVENEMTMNVTYMKVVYGDADIVEYDAVANIYVVDGVDQLATYRANLGLT